MDAQYWSLSVVGNGGQANPTGRLEHNETDHTVHNLGQTSRDVGKVVHAFRKPIADNLESLMSLGLEKQSD